MSDRSVSVKESLNKLPPFWDRNVIFLANIFSLFYGNEAETDMLRHEVGALETYGGRLVPILDLLFAKKNNLLILEKSPDQTLVGYFKELGLSLPEIAIVPENFQQKFDGGNHGEEITSFLEDLKSRPCSWLDGYVTDQALSALAKHTGKKLIGSIAGSQNGNNKFLLHKYLEKNNLPTFDTYEAEDYDGIVQALEKLSGQGYKKAVVKSQVGASGIGMQRVDMNKNISGGDFPAYLFFEGPVLVQGWMDGTHPSIEYIASPSVQIFIDDEHCWLYDVTEQILSHESVHEGNISPPPFFARHPEAKEKLLEQARIAGDWLTRQGYRGTASVDFHVVRQKNDLQIRICEINARVTGATYPAILAKHFLPDHTWMMRNVRFAKPLEGKRLLTAVKDKNLLFSKDSEKGILPFNFNMNADEKVIKGQFIFLADGAGEANALLDQMRNTPLLEGEYDRD